MSNQLYESLNAKTTDELKYIFCNDQDSYRPEAITIIKKILVERGEDITQVEQNEETQRQQIIEQRLQEKMNRHKLGKTQTPFQSFLKSSLGILWISVGVMLVFGGLNIYGKSFVLMFIFFPLHLIYFLVSLVNKKKKPKEEANLKEVDMPLISFLFVSVALIFCILMMIYNS